MLPLTYPRLWNVASILGLTSILAVALMPSQWLWHGEFAKGLMADKWVHCLTFAWLAFWFSGQFARDAYWRIGVGLLAFGVLIEICQRMAGHRNAEMLDIAADCIGIGIGLAIAVAGMGGWSLRFENALRKRDG